MWGQIVVSTEYTEYAPSLVAVAEWGARAYFVLAMERYRNGIEGCLRWSALMR